MAACTSLPSQLPSQLLPRRSNEALCLFRRYSSELFNAIQNPLPIAWSLFSTSLLDTYTLQKVSTSGIPQFQQVSALLEGVMSCLGAQPERLDEILERLESHACPPINAVVEKMRQRLVATASASDRRANSISCCCYYSTTTTDTAVTSPVLSRLPSDIAQPVPHKEVLVVEVDSSIRKKFSQIKGKFAGFFCKVKRAILDSNIQQEDIRDYVLFYYPFLEEDLNNRDLFLVLREQCSPTNCELLENIAENFELLKITELVNVYFEEEKMYEQSLLDHIIAPELKEELLRQEVETDIELKLQWGEGGVDNVTVREFRQIISEIFLTMSRYVHLYEVSSGCVHCKCRAPKQLEEVLRKLAFERAPFVVKRGVILLSVGGVVFVDMTARENGHSRESGNIMGINLTVEDFDIISRSQSTEEVATETVSHSPPLATPTETLPRQVYELLHLYSTHHGCRQEPANCVTCSKLERDTRTVLATYGTRDMPANTLLSPWGSMSSTATRFTDRGIGRSISNEYSSSQDYGGSFDSAIDMRQLSREPSQQLPPLAVVALTAANRTVDEFRTSLSQIASSPANKRIDEFRTSSLSQIASSAANKTIDESQASLSQIASSPANKRIDEFRTSSLSQIASSAANKTIDESQASLSQIASSPANKRIDEFRTSSLSQIASSAANKTIDESQASLSQIASSAANKTVYGDEEELSRTPPTPPAASSDSRGTSGIVSPFQRTVSTCDSGIGLAVPPSGEELESSPLAATTAEDGTSSSSSGAEKRLKKQETLLGLVNKEVANIK